MRLLFSYCTAIFPLCGLLLVPYLWAIWNGEKYFVWAPIVDSFHRCSDAIFYSALVSEAGENLFKYQNPVSTSIGSLALDYTRVASTRLAAFLTFGLDDPRWGLAVSNVVLIGLVTYLAFKFFARIGLEPMSGALGVHVFVLTFAIWSYPYDLSRFSSVFDFGSPVFHPEQFNDLYRFTIMQASACYAIFHLLSLSRILERQNWQTVVFHSVGLWLVTLAYIPCAIFAWGTSVGAVALTSLEQRRLNFRVAGSLGLAGLFVLSGDFLEMVLMAWRSPYALVVGHIEATSFLPMLHVLIFPILLLVFSLTGRFTPMARRLGILVGSTGVLAAISLAILGKAGLADRFWIRGFSCAVSLMLSGYAMFYLSRLQVFNKLLIPLLASLSMILFGRAFFIAHLGSLSHAYKIPISFWEVRNQVEAIARGGTSPPVVAALDATDNELLPVYSASHMYFADPNYAHVSAEDNFRRFVEILKGIGITKHEFLQWIQNYSNTGLRVDCRPEKGSPSSEQNRIQLLRNILYPPYIHKLYKTDVFVPGFERLSPEFFALVQEIYDSTIVEMKEVDLIITNRDIESVRKENQFVPPRGFEVVMNAPDRTIYSRIGSKLK